MSRKTIPPATFDTSEIARRCTIDTHALSSESSEPSAPGPEDANQALMCLLAHGACEFIATLLLLMAVMGGYAFLIAPWVAPGRQPFVLAGLLAAVLILIIQSPLGKLSGAHMNPAVSLAFWLERRLNTQELLVYVLMQFGGALTACSLLTLLLHDSFAAVGYGVLQAPQGLSLERLLVFEAGATGGLVALLFFTLSHHTLTRYTAAAVAAYLALMTILLAPLTGASFNPARAYGAALAAHQLDGQWPYGLAPLLGAALSVLLSRFIVWLPRPRYHRLNHSHAHANYTWHVLQDWQRRWRGDAIV